ncbi:MAG: cytochrome c [Gallionellaceae bacterium]
MNAVNRIATGLLVGMGVIWIMLPPEALAADAVNGQRLYLANCAGCHGTNGISIMQKAPNLARFEMRDQTDQALVDTIRSGGGSMPPYIGILKDSDLLDVVSFLRTLN